MQSAAASTPATRLMAMRLLLFTAAPLKVAPGKCPYHHCLGDQGAKRRNRDLGFRCQTNC